MINLTNYVEKSYPLIKIEGFQNQKTLFFNIGKRKILPGQFFMLNYNNCQKPISVSHYENEIIGFTIQDRGECTKKMINSKIGEYFGLTGPLGTSFKINYKKLLLIGGGIGSAPIYFLAKFLLNKKIDFDLLFGAKNIEYLHYCNDIKELNNSKFYTEDNSSNYTGYVTDGIDELINNNFYDCCCICGPEQMMIVAINKIKNKIKNIQISMERYMKCGIGLCGSCVIDDIGLRVCFDGPVFNYNILKKSKEFGFYHRNEYGIIENFSFSLK